MTIIFLGFRKFLNATICAAALAGSLGPARAEMSGWIDNEGGRMRLIALPPGRDGTMRGALQIEPNPGWITYWREPGNSGIPPQITVAPESGITLTAIRYPVPKHLVDGKIDDIAYDAPVSLPLTFSAKDASGSLELKASAFIGICKDICIPFQAEFSLPIAAANQSRPEEEAILKNAEASLPEKPSSQFKVISHKFSEDMKELWLQVALPDGGDTAPEVILTGPSGYVFTRKLMSKRDGKNFSTSIAVDKLPKNYEIARKSWSVLIIDGGRAMETPLAFD
ncbi:protein-disulfide reductase DsbD domain-containing protein [Rhizobium mongolense]|uniref:protein-disulfide reductase DsbD domain-containing protein n=1 Tax=Rhizobium TaxID=379 RepID=UPI0024B0D80F|nr:protein-disulfide reductase DsbD domain-containing protein [Rhizobium sp. CC1099]WFU88126.1 protein-disulfide reductase DsbD family protein [Rhizobium sp. CC1099]